MLEDLKGLVGVVQIMGQAFLEHLVLKMREEVLFVRAGGLASELGVIAHTGVLSVREWW